MNRLYWRLLRLICTVWRLGTLRIVNMLLRSTSSPCVLSRRFCGGRLHLDVGRSAAQGELFLLGETHVAERFLLATLVTPGMTIVDVGANIGYYVLLLAKLGGPRSTIIAIEPSPENLPELRLNIANNHLSSVRLIASAVGAEAGSVSFNAGLNGGVAQTGVYTVPIAALDDLVPDSVDFLKIDIDGFEGYALQGAQQLLSRVRPTLFLEFHPHLVPAVGHSFETVRAILEPIYGAENIAYYDVPSHQSLATRLAVRYLNTNPVRRLAQSPGDSPEGHSLGTYWIVCTKPGPRDSLAALRANGR